MSLKINKIEYDSIFTRDYNPLIRNNEINFASPEEIAVVYGPNGTGKTSLIKVLSGVKGSKLEFEYEGITYASGETVFHIINDQNNRNIILGEERDFFLGDNIKHEFELQTQVAEDRNNVLSGIIGVLKANYGISAGNSPLIELINNAELSAFIKDCVNSKSKGGKYSTENLVKLIKSLKNEAIDEYDKDKLVFLQNDIANKQQSIIEHVRNVMGIKIVAHEHIYEIEENNEAISILSRFHKSKCIVCDNDNIDWESLLKRKTENRQATIDALEDGIKEAIEKAISLIPSSDPFGIKDRLLNALAKGSVEQITELFDEIKEYIEIYNLLINNSIVEIVEKSELIKHFEEYNKIISEKPDIADEDYLYIREIISNSMSKPLTIERDDNKRLKIYLSHQEFLGKKREELPLSTGEQNFLSLAFEFLKAKNSTSPIVVIDDPVSSFDSIYKNKVVYAIVKMLHQKKRIVLTHNTDLIRLLEGQYKHCFKLYLLNNTDGEMNGFIPLKNNEQEMLISLEKLIAAFRHGVPESVVDSELFLISMIPFMRGYANIIGNKTLFDELTQVMHGYKTEKVDIGKTYSILFGTNSYLPNNYEVSVSDILNKTVDGKHLLDTSKYPLLDRTLQHSFGYLFLRLLVEKKLVDKFSIDTTVNEQLGQIISAAYPDENDIEQIRNRIRLTSKKTLINEFNHFEGNLSIFQPAIDITDQSLGKERTDILSFVNTL